MQAEGKTVVNEDGDNKNPDSSELPSAPSDSSSSDAVVEGVTLGALERRATATPRIDSVLAANQPLVVTSIARALAAMNQPIMVSGIARAVAIMNQQLVTSGVAQTIADINQQFARSGVVQAMTAANRMLATSGLAQAITNINRQSAASVLSSLRTMESVTEQLNLAYPLRMTKSRSNINVRLYSTFDERFAHEDTSFPYTDQHWLHLFDQLIDHKGLRQVCRNLYSDGYYAISVERAFIYVDNTVQSHSGLTSKYGADLMRSAFGVKSPVLKFNSLQSLSERNAQQGYTEILAGAMTGIRNPLAHDHSLVDDPKTALEQLVLANHLMKRIEAANKD